MRVEEMLIGRQWKRVSWMTCSTADNPVLHLHTFTLFRFLRFCTVHFYVLRNAIPPGSAGI